jgi:hypothetical protein
LPPAAPARYREFQCESLDRRTKRRCGAGESATPGLGTILFSKVLLASRAYARGTGDEIDGGRLGGLNGLAPNVQNYAIGFSVTFPVMDLAAIAGIGNKQI